MANFSEITNPNLYLFDGDDINLNSIYIKMYNSIPNEKQVSCKLKLTKLIEHFIEVYNLNDKPHLIRKTEFFNKIKNQKQHKSAHPALRRFMKKPSSVKYYIIPKERILVFIHKTGYTIFYDENNSEQTINDIEETIQLYIKPKKKKKKHFYMITFEYNNFTLNRYKIKQTNVDINLHYNDDFADFHRSVTDFLAEPSKSGLVLMHGITGSGKTSYIRHLINNTEKKFIFVPLHMANNLSNPELIPFLSEQKNSILIIEDAEKLIESRDSAFTENGIATLLNMSDGLLSDALGIKIICTFNTELKNIDKALLRKGRMINRYEFTELSVEKANAIAKLHHLNYQGTSPITLGDLYNSEKDNTTGQKREKKIGF